MTQISRPKASGHSYELAQHALRDPLIQRLMTLPGADMTVASGVAAAIGFGDTLGSTKLRGLRADRGG